MGGKYELRCFEPISSEAMYNESVEFFNNWFQMRKAYKEKKRQYAKIYLIIRKTLKN